MDLTLPKTRNGWIALIVGACIAIAFLYFATNVFKAMPSRFRLKMRGTKDIFFR
jgi:hypothetical protein